MILLGDQRVQTPVPARALEILSFLLLVILAIRPLSAQTAWTTNPNAPSNLPTNAKLKFANNSFRLVWQQSSSYPAVFSSMDLKDIPEIPTPYSLVVNYQTMGVTSSSTTRKLTIRYATSSGEYQATVQDNSSLNIPSSSHTLVGPPQAVTGFIVLSATYGTTTSFVDVKSVFRTKNLSFSSSYPDLASGDFTYDGNGALLLFGGNYSPQLAYPLSSGNYQTTSISYNSSTNICGVYGNGKLITGFSDTSYYSSDPGILYATSSSSYSTSSWLEPVIAPGFQVKRVIYEAGKFIAVGSRYDSTYSSSTKGGILVSTDGVEWTTVVISGTTSIEAVCRDGTQWVAVGNAGAVLTSTNGFEWTLSTLPSAGDLLSVACSNGYCVVGSSAGKIYSTTNYSSWTPQYTASGAVNALASGDGKFMTLIGTKVYQSVYSPLGVADIFVQPTGLFVIPQQSVTLSVEAIGTGPLAYQWHAGSSGDTSQPIAGATGSSYQTPTLDGSASYWVRVSNGIGSEDSQTATLTMQAPPVITSQPQNKVVAMGGSASTFVTVTGNNIAYQWYKGFSGDTSAPVAGKTSSSFSVPNTSAGINYYWAKASNALGTVNSISIRIEVTSVSPAIVDEPLDCVTFRGNSKPISVQANGPFLTYQWYAGNSGDVSVPVSGTSSSFYPPDGIPGNYQFWVRVSNPVGFVNSRTVFYSVFESLEPLITRQPYDTTTYVGSSKSISVTASGDNLTYAWYSGESGVTSVLLSDSSSSFSPNYSFPGTYRFWVRVSNPSGFSDSAAATYIVTPIGTGLISKNPVDTSTVLNSSVSLSVTASGSGLSYQWYSGASGDTTLPLSGKTSSSLSPSVAAIGQQSYWVRVTSGSNFENSQAAVLKIIPAILVITDPPVDQSTYVGDSFYYYVYTSGVNLTYQWYSGVSGDIANPLVGKTSYSFSPPVTAAGVFQYWMRATSGLEHVDSPAATVTVIGRGPFLTSEPQDQVLSQGVSSFFLSATLDSITGATWQWYQGVSGDTGVPLTGKTSSSLSITSPVAGTYLYWVRATNPYGIADSRTAIIVVSPASFTHWLVQNGLPSNGSGMGALGATPNDDGIPNLLKYALGMDVTEQFDGEHGPHSGKRIIGDNVYFTLEFFQSKSAQGVQLEVEESTALSGWSATAVESGPSYDNGDGTMTRTFRNSQPIGSEGSGYLRLKATSN